MGNEYVVFATFVAGVLTQAFLVAGSLRGAGGVLGIAAAAAVAAWFLSSGSTGQDRLFEFMMGSALVFVIVFALAFRGRLMPRISLRSVLHYTLLFYYVFAIRTAILEVPTWLYVVILAPGVMVGVLPAVGSRMWRGTRLGLYVWFLLVLIWLAPTQWSPAEFQAVYRDTGFSLQLYTYAFFAGWVFLFVVSNILYLLLLLPVERTRTSLFYTLFGRPETFSKGHARHMVGRVSVGRFTGLAAGLWLIHAGLVLGNLAYGAVSPALFVNASVALLAWTGIGGAERGEAGP